MNYDYDENYKDALNTVETPDFDILSNIKQYVNSQRKQIKNLLLFLLQHA